MAYQSTPFFVVGCPRSGTTLVRRILNEHRQLCVPEETHFIPRLFKRFCRLWDQGEKSKALALVRSEPIVQGWDISLDHHCIPSALKGNVAYSWIIDRVMILRAQADGKSGWGDKTPAYVFHIPTLNKIFPQSRFINVVRDGRDVALSLVPLSWGPNNVFACAKLWKAAILAWEEQLPSLGERAFEVQYERLLKDPETVIHLLCDFLGIDFSSRMLDTYPIRAGNTGKWRNKFNMSPLELQAFESVAGDTLEDLGYPRQYENPGFPLHLRIFAQADNVWRYASNRLLRR